MNNWFVQSINMSSWKRTIFFNICITKNRNGYRSTTPTGTRRSRNIVDIVLCKTWQTRYNLFLNTYYFIDYDSLLYRQTFIDIHMWRNEHLGLTPDVYFGHLDKNPVFLMWLVVPCVTTFNQNLIILTSNIYIIFIHI